MVTKEGKDHKGGGHQEKTVCILRFLGFFAAEICLSLFYLPAVLRRYLSRKHLLTVCSFQPLRACLKSRYWRAAGSCRPGMRGPASLHSPVLRQALKSFLIAIEIWSLSGSGDISSRNNRLKLPALKKRHNPRHPKSTAIPLTLVSSLLPCSTREDASGAGSDNV